MRMRRGSDPFGSRTAALQGQSQSYGLTLSDATRTDVPRVRLAGAAGAARRRAALLHRVVGTVPHAGAVDAVAQAVGPRRVAGLGTGGFDIDRQDRNRAAARLARITRMVSSKGC